MSNCKPSFDDFLVEETVYYDDFIEEYESLKSRLDCESTGYSFFSPRRIYISPDEFSILMFKNPHLRVKGRLTYRGIPLVVRGR